MIKILICRAILLIIPILVTLEDIETYVKVIQLENARSSCDIIRMIIYKKSCIVVI